MKNLDKLLTLGVKQDRKFSQMLVEANKRELLVPF